MRLTVSPLVLAVSLGLLNPAALDAEVGEDPSAEGAPGADLSVAIEDDGAWVVASPEAPRLEA